LFSVIEIFKFIDVESFESFVRHLCLLMKLVRIATRVKPEYAGGFSLQPTDLVEDK
jgi:hypothetical protein